MSDQLGSAVSHGEQPALPGPINSASATAGNVNLYGNSKCQVGHTFNTHQYTVDTQKALNEQCLQDLCITNPESDKMRIESTKGGLLKESYMWIRGNPDFLKFREQGNRLLWIKGDPGKGKTMLLCGVINELKKCPAVIVSYFFCQDTQIRLKNAASIIRGLIWLLCSRHTGFIAHVRQGYDTQGKQLFEDHSAFESLDKIFNSILQDKSLKNAVFIVDALDECSKDDRHQIINLIIEYSQSYPHKWIVSSRNWPEIEEQFRCVDKISLSLELNKETISQAVKLFIQHRVDKLAIKKRYGPDTKAKILETLQEKANDTFLWVVLVCNDLARPVMDARDALDRVNSVPEGLDQLYNTMLRRISQSHKAHTLKKVLATACVAFRPISVDELRVLVSDLKGSNDEIESDIQACGFLTVQNNIIYLVHQSALDFLLSEPIERQFNLDLSNAHYDMFRNSLDGLSALCKDIYGLRSPGILVDKFETPSPDPLASLRYSCLYWVDHLKNLTDPLLEHKSVEGFLTKKFLFWLEALSLLRKISEGESMFYRLGDIMKETSNEGLKSLIEDARIFIIYNAPALETAPLQTYASALAFSPMESLVRKLFEREQLDWIEMTPKTSPNWNSCIKTLHLKNLDFSNKSDGIKQAEFSPDGQLLAFMTKSSVYIWNWTLGKCIGSLKTDSNSSTMDSVSLKMNSELGSLIFSSDSQQVIISLRSGECLLWKMDTTSPNQIVPPIESQNGDIPLRLSHDGKRMVRLRKGATIEPHVMEVWDLDKRESADHDVPAPYWDSNFLLSDDGRFVISSRSTEIIHIWEKGTSEPAHSWQLENHRVKPGTLAFLSDNLLAAVSGQTIKIRNLQRPGLIDTLANDHHRIDWIYSLGHGQGFAAVSWGGWCKLWDHHGNVMTKLDLGLDNVGQVLAYSAARRLFSWVGRDGGDTARICDMKLPLGLSSKDGHTGSVSSIQFIAQGTKLISRSLQNIHIWDSSDGTCIYRLPDGGRECNTTQNGEWLSTTFGVTAGYCSKIYGFKEAERTGKLDIIRIPFGQILTFAPNSRYFASSTWGLIRLYQCAEAFEFLKEIQWRPGGDDSGKPGQDSKCSFCGSGQLDALAFVDNSRALAFSVHSTVKVWHPHEHDKIRNFSHDDHVQYICPSNSGRSFAVLTESHINVWNLDEDEPVHKAPIGFQLPLRLGEGCFTLSSSGGRAAFGFKKWIYIWTFQPKTLLHTIRFDHEISMRVLWFDEVDELRLHTNLGILVLHMTGPVTGVDIKYDGYALSHDGTWILNGNERLLYLPWEYRIAEIEIAGSNIAFGCQSGEVLLMRLGKINRN